ncbi:hypothetical protein [Caulobacter sp.]|uniref:DUF4870 family protein n=1 Tax=Caulobacter sp. TaxID=78 RepID=UPI002B48C6F5|nr:hypothetical protein [Caulobacter sp.]HJV40264.1 hypothetical protein [Caulobacter sp.]
MTDVAPVAEEDKVLPAVVYGLYLLGFTNGLTFVVGLIVAYVGRDAAGPINRSHFEFNIRSFWLAIAGFLIGGALLLLGIPLSLLLIGIPMMIAGGLILTAISVWFVARCVMGIYYLVRGEAYPRPLTWLI